jgi:hypothetical protein
MDPLLTLTPTQRKLVQCVAVALNLLPNSYLNSIIATLDLAINTLQAALALIEGYLLSLGGVLTMLRAQKAMILSLVSGVRSQINIIEMSVIIQCPVLGEVNKVVNDTIDNLLAPLYGIINQIDCLNRIYLEYQDKKAIIQAQIDMLKTVRTAIQSVLNLRAAAVTAAKML